MKASVFEKKGIICYALSPKNVALEGLEELKSWKYKGRKTIPKDILKQAFTKRFHHYIFVVDGKVVKILV